MADIGKRNQLQVLRETSSGLYLQGDNLGELLLPGRFIPKGTVPGDVLDVFVYRDSEDRLVATTETPKAQVGEFAALQVINIHPHLGAFLDWGLSKDLLLPEREQAQRVTQGQTVVVFLLLDPKTRIVATTRITRHLDLVPPRYQPGQKVQLLIAGESPLGFKAIVENSHLGLLYHSELGITLEIGQKIHGYVRAIREDGKIDLRLDPAGYQRVASLTDQILDALRAAGGRLEFDDKSSPESIRETFHTSKKAFKQALGALYQQRLIRFENNGTTLVGS